jgi:uncharacterized protein
MIFGATGRVGSNAVRIALDRGLPVTAVVRDPARMTVRHDRLNVLTADTLDLQSTSLAIREGRQLGVTGVVMAVGSDLLKRSTVVTETVRNISTAMMAGRPKRYLGISGTAQMAANGFGHLARAVIRTVIKGARDHQGAYDLIAATELDYVLAGCPYIKDGAPTRRRVEQPGNFTIRFATITPTDVADFLITQLMRHRYNRQIVGIWN